jgi:glycosyltransferase involved in cell wall biosynthesis
MLDPRCRHVVVSQNLLPHLWKTGALGGRSFDVLIERWPLEELQRRLDLAKSAHPQSTTLGDFRADPDLVRSEREALAAAARLVTPHRALAKHFGHRAWLLDWEMPTALPRRRTMEQTLFFPASRLGRKGAFEFATAMRGGISASVKYLGRADEGTADPFSGMACGKGSLSDLAAARALVLPAWIEHQPRLALLALASGVPVIATEDCGLPEHDLLHEIPSPDPAMLADAIRAVLASHESACVA